MTKSASGHRTVLLAGVFLLTGFYAFTVTDGYHMDDFGLVSMSFGEWLRNPFAEHGRPVWVLSYLIVNLVSTSSYVHHLVNVLLLMAVGLLAAWVIRRRGLPPFTYLLALTALCHPAMTWPVSWISQRNDLLLLVFTLLALELYSRRAGVIWVILSSWSKAPFVFQNLVFGWAYVRRGRPFSALLAVAGAVPALYFVWKTYYLVKVESARGLYQVKGEGIGEILAVLAARGAKLLEGVVYTFVPAPAYYTGLAVVIGVSLAILLLWGYLIRAAIRAKPAHASASRSWLLLCVGVGVSMIPPYAFGTGMRICVPATLFLYLALGSRVPDRRGTRAAWAAITALFFLGATLNYGPVRSDDHDLGNPVFTEAPVTPMVKYAEDRDAAVGWIIRRISK